MRQRRDFDAHVHEYAALKTPALPFQARKMRILQIRPTPAIASAFAPASLRKAAPRPRFDDGPTKGKKASKTEKQRKERQRQGVSFCEMGEPVRLIYANPTFTP